MFNAELVGHKISVLRKKRGITQMELANRLGLSFQAVSNWERGVAMPDIGNLKLLAQILETTVDDILGDERTARIISDAEEGKTPSEPVKPEELLAVAPLLEPEQNDALIGAVNGSFNDEQIKEIKPNLSFGGEFDKSDAELAEMFFEKNNVAMFSIVEDGLSGERRRELLRRAVEKNNMAFIAMLSDAATPEEQSKFAEDALERGNIALLGMFEGSLPPEKGAEYAMKAFESGNVATFSMLMDKLSPEQKRECYNRAAANGNVAMFSMLRESSMGKPVGADPVSARADNPADRKKSLLDKLTRLSNKYAELGGEYNRLRINGADEDELGDLEDEMGDLEDEIGDLEDELSNIEETEQEKASAETISSIGEKLNGLKGMLDGLFGRLK